MNLDRQSLTVRTPGKLILSGEHAVVYGNPALAMAVNRYTDTTISRRAACENILFHLLNFRYNKAFSQAALQRIKQSIHRRYQKFLQGKYDIRDVLKEPFELMQYALTHFSEKRKLPLPPGLTIHTESNIPIGCGMGSSAAAVVSLMYGVAKFSQLEVDLPSYYELAREGEHVQHGYSSGIDVYLVLHGGCIRFQKSGEHTALALPKQTLMLVDTGAPISHTGECVSHVASKFTKQTALLSEFAVVTEAMERAITQQDRALWMASIQENHNLLVRIGVVPSPVQQFITEIEALNGAAKICGAGAVRGDSAGVLLVIVEQDISFLVQKYNYRVMPVQGESLGTRVL